MTAHPAPATPGVTLTQNEKKTRKDHQLTNQRLPINETVSAGSSLLAASHVEPALRFLNCCLALDISLPHLATTFQRRQTTVVGLGLAWCLTALA
jgi:hypothetical protein